MIGFAKGDWKHIPLVISFVISRKRTGSHRRWRDSLASATQSNRSQPLLIVYAPATNSGNVPASNARYNFHTLLKSIGGCKTCVSI